MKKFIGVLTLTIALSFSLVACDNNANNPEENNPIIENNNQITDDNNNETSENNLNNNISGEVVVEPINTSFDVSGSLEYVEAETGLNAETKLDDAKIKENYNFGAYEELEKEIRSNITEDSISEIAIVKIGNVDQTAPIFGTLMKRREDLQNEYANNEKISDILNNGDCFVLKQQGGVVISIIAENATEIEQRLQDQF